MSATIKVACLLQRPNHNQRVLVDKTYRYRIYPTPEQEAMLGEWQHALRFLWNLALEQRLMGLAHPPGEKKFFSGYDQINQLKELRQELPWLADVPRNVSAQLLLELDKAWQRCFKQKLAKPPRFKSRNRAPLSLCEPHPKVWSLQGDRLTFPKLGEIRLVLHRPLEGKGKTCTIKQDGDQWFACISCEIEIADPLPSTQPALGMDRGVVNLLADSDGHREPNPLFGELFKKKLARAQREVSRKKKGSQNRDKAKKKVARIKRKTRRQRENKLHTLSHQYAKSHGVIVVEKLQIKNMTASARGTVEEPGKNVAQKAGLNRSILDSGWGALVSMLKYKVIPLGGQVQEVPAAYSSQTCSACGHVASENRPSQEKFKCVVCGYEDHADTNAAKVLLSRRIGGDTACGGIGAVGLPMKQECQRVLLSSTAQNVRLAPLLGGKASKMPRRSRRG
jgi:putative transposase